MKAGTHPGAIIRSMQPPVPYAGSGPMSSPQQQQIQSTIAHQNTGFGLPSPGSAQPGQLQNALMNSMSNLHQLQTQGSPQPGGPMPMSMPPNSFPPNGPMPPQQGPQFPMPPPQQGNPALPLSQGPVGGLGAPQQFGTFAPQLGGLMGGRYSQR